MMMHARYADGRVVGMHLGGADFETEMSVSTELFDGADGLFLRVDRERERFTVYADEGAAHYRVTGEGVYPGTVRVVLDHIERPCGTCKLRGRNDQGGERHHWWCDRVA